ncbi:hypothetical protein K440DRAFT_610966 [Wilcoxina mikolae CBS 423.85]|nr:hypothetical protein K440DRAFT_610966 [Wilcoxina mikolae CBS 423.85]
MLYFSVEIRSLSAELCLILELALSLHLTYVVTVSSGNDPVSDPMSTSAEPESGERTGVNEVQNPNSCSPSSLAS